jgi:hypothetical protein
MRGATAEAEAVRSLCVFQYSLTLNHFFYKAVVVTSHHTGCNRTSACHDSQALGLESLVSTFDCVLPRWRDVERLAVHLGGPQVVMTKVCKMESFTSEKKKW